MMFFKSIRQTRGLLQRVKENWKIDGN